MTPHTRTPASLGGAAKGQRVGNFDLAHLLLGHLRAALADAECGERDVDSLDVRRSLLLESIQIDHHLGDLGIVRRPSCGASPSPPSCTADS